MYPFTQTGIKAEDKIRNKEVYDRAEMQPVTVQAVQQRMRPLHKILRNPESPAYITMKAYYEGALTGVSEPLKKRDRWAENKVLLPQVLAGDISRMCGVLNESLLGVRGVSTGDDLRTLTECAKRPVAWQDAVKVAVGVAYVEWEEKEQARYLKRHDQRCEDYEYTPCDEWIADNTYFRMDIDYF